MGIQLLNQIHNQKVFTSREWERTKIEDMYQSLENFFDDVGGARLIYNSLIHKSKKGYTFLPQTQQK